MGTWMKSKMAGLVVRTALVALLAGVTSIAAAAQWSPASAADYFTGWRGCPVEFKKPYGRVVKDGNGDPYIVNANGRVWVLDDPDCNNNMQIVVCMDFKYKRSGSWGTWKNARKGPLEYLSWGCQAHWGGAARTSIEANSYGMASTAQEVDCADLQAVKVRSAVYFRDEDFDGPSSTMRRSGLASRVLTLSC